MFLAEAAILRCSLKQAFLEIHMKTPVLDSSF